MGLKKWILKRGLAGMVPKNAVEQFIKWRRRSPEMSEGEIAQAIFALRYITTDPNFNDDEMRRFVGYIECSFECGSLLDFCLASLDIEGGIDPGDGDAFNEATALIIEGLEERGFRVEEDHLQSFIDKWRTGVAVARL